MKASNIKCKLEHQIKTTVMCGSYIFEFSVIKDMGKKLTMIKRRIPGYLLAYLLTLIVKNIEN